MLTIPGRSGDGALHLADESGTVSLQARADIIDASPTDGVIGDYTATLVDFQFGGLKLRFDEAKERAAAAGGGRQSIHHRRERNEREIGDDEIESPDDGAHPHQFTEITGIHLVAHLDPRVRGDPGVQQASSNVARHHPSRATLEQAVDESPGRGAGIEHSCVANLNLVTGHRKVFKGRFQFESAPAHEAFHLRHRQSIALAHLSSRVEDGCSVHGDTIVVDQFECFGLAPCQSCCDERPIDSLRSCHALGTRRGTEHRVGECRQVVEHPIGSNGSIIR